MKSLTPLILAWSLASSTAFAAGGTVQVAFVTPDRFTDAGFGADRKSNLAVLSDELERLGKRYLDASQQLKVEVLDVDLAGRVPPSAIRDFRVMNGRADWPRIKLRWTLQNGDAAPRSGEETLSDMEYLQRPGFRPVEPLPYERRMLGEWFKSRFVAAADPR